MIEASTEPVGVPGKEDAQAFHVVAPVFPHMCMYFCCGALRREEGAVIERERGKGKRKTWGDNANVKTGALAYARPSHLTIQHAASQCSSYLQPLLPRSELQIQQTCVLEVPHRHLTASPHTPWAHSTRLMLPMSNFGGLAKSGRLGNADGRSETAQKGKGGV